VPNAGNAVSTRPYPPRYWWLLRLSVAFGLLFAFALLLRLWWGREADRRMAAYVAAARARGEPVLIEDFNRPTGVPDADNAVPLLRRAAAGIPLTRPEHKRWEAIRVDAAAGPTTRQAGVITAVVALNAQPLADARTARDRPWSDWNVVLSSPVMAMRLPELQTQRQLSWLMRDAALLDRRRGDHASAAERVRDMLAQSDAMQQYVPMVITHLIAIAQSRTASEVASGLATDMAAGGSGDGGPATRPADAVLVQALIADLLNESAYRTGGTRAWHGERLIALDAPSQFRPNTPLRRPLSWAAVPVFALDAARAAARHDAAARSTAAAAASRPPRPAAAAAAPTPAWRDVPLLARPHRALSGTMYGSFNRAVVIHFRGLAERRAAAAQLAIALYRRDHGGLFPPALDALVPRYLPAVPRDPLAAADRPLGYRPTGRRPVLYSVGANGADDGGTDALPPGLKPRQPDPAWDDRRPDRVWDLLPQPRTFDGSTAEGEDDGGDQQVSPEDAADDEQQ